MLKDTIDFNDEQVSEDTAINGQLHFSPASYL